MCLLRNGNAVFEGDFQGELPGVIVHTDLGWPKNSGCSEQVRAGG